jgi:3'-phosphoadenosine 5'-phosphosulfate sulfotransferase (PAPS reductase)/FAD synthetase
MLRCSIEIFSHGGGTQSAAITALIVQGKLPKPDFVCIVDTERERRTTWEYLDAVIRPALRTVGLEVHRIRNAEWASIPAHGLDWMSHNMNTLLLPAFTNQTGGDVGKLSGFCSMRWKVETKNRYLREVLGVPTNRQRNWIGFSLDESRRAIRMMKGEDYQAGLIRFPLIHDVPLRRQQAIREVEKMGWPTPPRSACWMCPNQADNEWRELKDGSPEEFAAACALEKEVQAIDPFAWFHESCVPIGEVDFTQPEDLFTDRACSSGGCFT